MLRDDESSTCKVICINNRIDGSVIVLSPCKRGVLLGVGIDEPSMYESYAGELEQFELSAKTSWPERRYTGKQWI